MNILAAMYRPSLALLTDLYELTMAYGYWKAGLGDCEAAFHLTYRENPFGGGYTVACGLEPAASSSSGSASSRTTWTTWPVSKETTRDRCSSGRSSISSAGCRRLAISTPCRKARSSFPRSRWSASPAR